MDTTERRSDVWVPETLDFEDARQMKDRTQTRNLFRYWWAWCVLEERFKEQSALLFDMGCGCGYGSRILVEQHPKVVVCGVDHNEVALTIAREEFMIQGQTDYKRLDLDVTWAGRWYNARPQMIVAFDLFERLKHRDAFLLYASQMLAGDGLFLLSTESDGATTFTPPAPYKLKYDRGDLLRLLRRFFGKVEGRGATEFPGKDWIDQVNARRRSPLGNELIACSLPLKD